MILYGHWRYPMSNHPKHIHPYFSFRVHVVTYGYHGMGGPTWVRTRDRPVMSRWLYQLSYGPLPSGSYHPLSIIPQVVCATLPSNSCQYLISSPVKRSSVADYSLHFKSGFKDFLRDGFRNFRTAGASILRICSFLKFNGSGFFPGP